MAADQLEEIMTDETNPPTDGDLQAAVTTEFLTLADLLDDLPGPQWDAASLCAGWRVREVVAHMTMPARYSMEEFVSELRACDGDFTRLSNVVAARDAELPVENLIGNLRDDVMHRWVPPGGGQAGALNHVVIHGLDITVPIGIDRPPREKTLRAVLDDLTWGGTHAHFGFDLTGLRLEASDVDWSFGSGSPVRGTADDLALLIGGRRLPAGRIRGVNARS
jgi:uncharacterized protein (TIGR03083 family)